MRSVRLVRWGRPVPAAAVLLVCLLLPSPAGAEGVESFALSAGAFDMIDGVGAVEAGFELRFTPRAFDLVPATGVVVNSDGGGYVYGGLRYDWDFAPRWVATPHFSVTLFEDGDGRDLGSVLEFRSGLEVAYELTDSSRVGLSFYHLSNAGVSETNPGSESLVLVYSFAR